MHRLAIIGDTDSVFAFQAVGMEAHLVTRNEVEKVLRKLVRSKKFAIIFLAESLMKYVKEYLSEIDKRPLPAVTIIPMGQEKTNIGLERMKKICIHATGTDIISKMTK